MAYAKASQPIPLIKAAVQLDLLEIGKEYIIKEPLRGGCTKKTEQKLIGIFKDYYLFEYIHSPGHRETYMKIDIHNGSIIIEGLNIKEKVLEAVEDLKIKEAERVKVSKEMIGKAITEGYNWIIENPGQSWIISEKCKDFDGYQKKKIAQGVWEKLVFEGFENRVQQVTGPGGSRGFNLKYKAEPEKVEPEKAETYKAEEMSATLESTTEILRVDGLKSVSAEMLGSIEGTMTLLRSVGKNVVLDIVFREV